MQKLQLSTLSTALISAGLLFSAQAQAAACSNGLSITGATDSVSGCTISRDLDSDSGYNRNWASVTNSNFSISNSNVTATSRIVGYSGNLLNATDSTVNVTNSTLSLDVDTGDLLDIKRSTLTVTDSKLNVTGDGIASVILLENGSTATVNNTVITALKEVDAISFHGTNNRMTLNNSTVNSPYALGSWWDVDGGTEYGGLDLTLNNSTVTSDIFSVASEYDEEDDTIMVETINITANNSQLSGVIAMPGDTSSTSNYSLTLNNSTWTTKPADYTNVETNDTTTYTNHLTNLALNKGAVNLSKIDGFQTLTVGNLSGTGNFTLNTDLANQQSDKIVVTGSDKGSFGLKVNDSGNEPKAANGKVTLVETPTGTATFSLLGKDYVDAGAYRYRLAKAGTNWVLSNKESELASNTNDDVATNGNVAANQVVLSEKSNALVSLRQAQLALVENSLEGLHQRLGELNKGEQGNVWVRNVNSRNEMDATDTASNSRSSGFKQDVHTLQVGADVAATDNLRVGAFVGNSRSDVDFDGEYGSGKVKSQALGLYATYLANNGFYSDIVAKYEHLKSESNSTGKRKYNAYTLSSEIGRHHNIGNWVITPQLQAAWTNISSLADEERVSALTARAGVRVVRPISFATWTLQPYAEVNGITTRTNSNQVRVNQYSFDVAESRGRMQTALGVNAVIGAHRFGVEGSVSNGKHLDQPYRVQAAYRYSW